MLRSTIHQAVAVVVIGLALLPLAGDPPSVATNKKDAKTELYVRTIPSGAKVSVDGKLLGTTDGLFSISAGTREVVVRLEGFDTEERTVTVRGGKITRLILELQKERLPESAATLGPWISLLESVDLDRDPVHGRWHRDGLALCAEPSVAGGHSAKLMLPVIVEGGYELEVEFTRTAGRDAVLFVLPVGEHECTLQFSAALGAVGGLELVGGKNIFDDNNPALIRPSRLTNRRRYKAQIGVRTSGQRARIEASLDGEPFLHWTGKPSSLGLVGYWNLPEWKRPALAASECSVTFHSARLRPVSGEAVPVGAAEIRKLPGHQGAVRSLDLSPDRCRAVIRSDTALRVWDLENLLELCRLDDLAGSVERSFFLPDGRQVVATDPEGNLFLFDLDSNWPVRSLVERDRRLRASPSLLKQAAGRMTLSADGRWLVAGDDQGTVLVWDRLRSTLAYRWSGFSEAIACVAVSPLGRHVLAAGCEDDALQLLRRDEWQDYRLTGHSGILAIACSPDGKQAATAARDGTVAVWDIEDRRIVHRMDGHSGPVRCVAFARHGDFLLSGGDDGTVRLWQTTSGRQIHAYSGHTGPVTAVAFVGLFFTAEHRAISGSDDCTVRFWRLPERVARESKPGAREATVPDGEADLPPDDWTELLDSVDLNTDRVLGQWLRDGREVASVTGRGLCARVMLPVEAEGSYDFSMEFTPAAGSGSVDVILPVGGNACNLKLGGWGGSVHGLATVDGMDQNHRGNPATVRPGRQVNGRRYHLQVGVRVEDPRLGGRDADPLHVQEPLTLRPRRLSVHHAVVLEEVDCAVHVGRDELLQGLGSVPEARLADYAGDARLHGLVDHGAWARVTDLGDAREDIGEAEDLGHLQRLLVDGPAYPELYRVDQVALGEVAAPEVYMHVAAPEHLEEGVRDPVAQGALRVPREHAVHVLAVEGSGAGAAEVDPPRTPLEAVHVHDGHADEASPEPLRLQHPV